MPELRFSDIGGLEKSKQLIRETIEYPLKFPELSARYGKKAGGGLLFFGPPGCGKTMLARAAAGECGVAFINVNLATRAGQVGRQQRESREHDLQRGAQARAVDRVPR